MKAHVLIVPTGGFKPGSKEPSKEGIMRLVTADIEVRAGNVGAVVISGGRRLDGLSEASAYCRYAKEYLPDLYDAIVLVDAQEACTNRDLVATNPKLRSHLKRNVPSNEEPVIGITSYQEHMERAEIVLRYLGYLHIWLCDSGEPRAYSERVEKFLTRVTRKDPAWRWLGWPLVVMANRRIKE